MKNNKFWINSSLALHKRLTESVTTILQNLMKNDGIEFLSVSGRTKTFEGIIEKIKRKGYENPEIQMTDISGIRVIVYFESDIQKVSELIKKAFEVDYENSFDQVKQLSVNQIGYRSTHYVGSLGDNRCKLPEFQGFTGLKFEIQVRTVLQHAWAEIAHDRQYKFSTKLPPDIERELYLYAGLLEIADKGFDSLTHKIAEYTSKVQNRNSIGDFDYSLDSVSLTEFFNKWTSDNNLKPDALAKNSNMNIDDLINELSQFGVTSGEQLLNIIPKDYVKVCNNTGFRTNIFGHIRTWMMISDWKRLKELIQYQWIMDTNDISLYKKLMPKEIFEEFYTNHEWRNFLASNTYDEN